MASLCLGAAVSSLARGARAEEPRPDAGTEVHAVEEVVVTGSRTERPLSEAPVATEVISRDEIEQSGAETVADVLEEHPSLYVPRNFAGAGVQLQGLDPEYTLILVDGQRTTGRIGGVNDLTRIPIEDVERIEIVRGAGSALYGSDAIGGVVNIITRRTREPVEAEARAAYGSFNLADVSARGGVSAAGLNTRLSAGFHRGDGYDLDPSDIATNGSAFNQLNVGNRTSYAFDDKRTLTLAGEYLFRDQRGIDVSGAGAIFDRANRTESLSVRLGPEFVIDGPSRVKLWVGYSLFRDQFLQDQRGSTALDQVQDTREQLGQAGSQLDWLIARRHLVTAGTEGFYEHLRSERLEGGVGERVRGAVYLQDEWTIAADIPRFIVVPGARVDLDSQFGAHPTPRLAVRFDPHERVVLRASYGLGFRAPDFRELFLFFQNPSVGYVVEGNQDLRPETSRSANVAVEYEPANWLWMSLGAFRNDLDDMITTELVDDGGAGGAQRFRYQNVSSAYTQGLDLVVRVRPVAGLSLDLGYSLLDTRDNAQDRPLAGRPRHRGTAGVRYRYRPWRFELMTQAAIVGPRPFFRDDDGDGVDERVDADPYATVDVRVEQGIGKHVSVFVLAENLLDAGDPEFLAIQPRTFMGGLEARY